MTRGRQLLLFGTIALLVSGCGASAQVRTQGQEITYQTAIAQITHRLARSPRAPVQVVRALQMAIKQFETMKAPAPVRELHTQLVAGFRQELEALQRATAPGADAATIHAAVRADSRAQLVVNRTLRRMTSVVGACRTDAAHC